MTVRYDETNLTTNCCGRRKELHHTEEMVKTPSLWFHINHKRIDIVAMADDWMNVVAIAAVRDRMQIWCLRGQAALSVLSTTSAQTQRR